MAQLNPGARVWPPSRSTEKCKQSQGYEVPTDAMEIRNWYKTYFFNAVGAVPFQMERISYMWIIYKL